MRNRRRTAITLLSIVSGVMGIVILGGFIEFAFMGLRESTIRTQLGHTQIYREGFLAHGETEPGRYLIDDPEPLIARLADDPRIIQVSARLSFSGLLSVGDRSLPCRGIGVDIEREEEMSAFETLVGGRQLETGDVDGAVIGAGLATALGAKVGDYLTILSTTYGGSLNAVDITVVGIAETGAAAYDGVFVKVPLAVAKSLLHTGGVERVVVLVEETERLDEIAPVIRAAVAAHDQPLETRVWSDMAPFYHKVVALYTGLFTVISVIIGAVVFFSIANTISMSLFERTREIGTLRAIGATRGTVMRLFVFEGVALGVIGGIAGVVAGLAAAYAINMSGGIDIPPPPGMSRGYVSLILPVPWVMATTLAMTVAVAAVSSLLPSLRASRIDVVEALRHV
jgi:putative ABC transport system permease protein